MWLNSGWIWMQELIQISDELNLGHEGKTRAKDDLKAPVCK